MPTSLRNPSEDAKQPLFTHSFRQRAKNFGGESRTAIVELLADCCRLGSRCFGYGPGIRIPSDCRWISTIKMPFPMKLDPRIQPIQLIISDVDGVLTDGGISFDNQGIETKKFHVRDGMGIKLWQRAGHHFAILTARSSHIVKLRAAELNIPIVRQGFEDKFPIAQQIMDELRLAPENVCYIGDDLTDLRVMNSVGLSVAVADAATDVLAAAHMTTNAPGGFGAVRELVEKILRTQKRWDELVRSYVGL